MRRFAAGLFVIILISFSLLCFGQKNKTAAGYVIGLNNDTVQCLFKTRNWKKQPQTVTIIVDNKDSLISPQTTLGFSIPSLQIEYASKVIEPANYVDKLQDATILKAPEHDVKRSAFVKVLHNGRFDLLLYLDGIGKKHFFIEGENNFVELYSHYYMDKGDSRRIYDSPITVLDKAFELVLKTLMTPCRTIFSIIENIQLTEEHLKRVFEIYDTCMDSKKNG